MNLPEWLSTLDINREQLFEFFVLYSRYEYALKRAGYIQKDVEANWDKFAKDIKGQFEASTSDQLKSAVKYLRERPPLLPPNWEVRTHNSRTYEEKIIIDAVKDVRNTLFHGGKYPFHPVEDPSRNQQVIESCIKVLWETLAFHNEVRTYFFEPI